MTVITQSQSLTRYGRRYLSTCVLLFCGLASLSQNRTSPPAAFGQSGAPAISVQTALVVLPVSVTDMQGNAVSGLSRENFRVYEDGNLQDVTMFQQQDTPVTVGLIVDHSRSMGSKLPEVATAVSAFAQSSNPSDELFVVDFNDDVSVELLGGKAFTHDPSELVKAVFSVRARGRTALYDAVAEGLLHVQLGHCDKKALIIVSDGGDNASQQKLSQVLSLARQTQVVIYSIGLVGDGDEVDPAALRRLSKATGGIAFFPDRMDAVATVSAQIARDLRELYTLGFSPPKSNKARAFRKIEVKVAAPGHGKLHARTRTGYSVPEEMAMPAEPAKGAK
ncbi:MAG: VWA domain-containing protein [Candidatus Acidiferrales bacterium]